mmetsp:Transcript_22738/g.19768  ORF Transcript_22738/g.19768 Transcript_22738/m.19768 type:complete len:194 (+) Transcript_22738:468-1049(+)
MKSVLEKGKLQAYLKEKNPDILCLNETKCDEDQLQAKGLLKWIPEEYSHYFNCCLSQKGYSGTAIISRYKPISVQYGIGVKEHDVEGRVVTCEYENFYVVTSYVPNAGQKLDRLDYRTNKWDVDFKDYLNGLKAKKHVIWCGDLNVCHQEIDIHKPKGNEKSAGFTPEERQRFTEFLEDGWVDSFRHLYPDKQ